MTVKKAGIARLAGMTWKGVNDAANAGRLVKDSGGKFDTENPVNKAFILAHRKKKGMGPLPAEAVATANEDRVSPIAAPHPLPAPENDIVPDLGDDITADAISKMTLAELAKRFGGLQALERYVILSTRVQEAAMKEIKADMVRGGLVSTATMTSVFSRHFEGLHKALADFPERFSSEALTIFQKRGEEGLSELVHFARTKILEAIEGADNDVKKRPGGT
jgi:hypothetical protein